MPPPLPAHTAPTRALLVGALLLMAAFSAVISMLPVPKVQPVVSVVLGLSNVVAFFLLIRRARQGGPEERGWWILALSFLGVVGSNTALFMAPATLGRASLAEKIFVGIQPVIAIIQAWALLSWPFRAPERQGKRLMNLLGCGIFGGSLFLVLWSTTLYQELDHGQWPIFIRLMGLAVRVAIVGGVATYILADDPRRIRGPVGLIFVAAVAILAVIVLVRPYLYDESATMQATPWLGIVLCAPLAFALAAWLGHPVEVPADEPRLKYPLVEGLLYLPFVAVGGVLILSALHHRDDQVAPLIGYMAISGLLLARQFLLLREVRRANEQLEERVQARTRTLEELQKVMLRTERLNSLGALGAGLAHDLNNALAGIRATAELAHMKAEDGQPCGTSELDRILVAADQSAALTGRLMAFARQEVEALGPLDLALEASRLESLLRMLLPRNVSLHFDMGPSRVPIRGSRNHLEQILVNLVCNARDAMPTGGTITLRVLLVDQEAPPGAVLQVEDTGGGMPPEVLDHLFEPLFTTKAPGKGTGLGLASVKHLVNEAGGRIEVHSRLGQGSRFILHFPLLDA
ncbi:MAG: ATP-binding protein [Geothrix sp.]|uniref:ATP-binding protein n=1 Tax=Geothrix sp. TaxID=1962974 RepID=UPI003BB16E6A